MDIYALLQSKPHNEHHLKRYFKFIQTCCQANSDLPEGTYTEEHHICPKASDLFPEYKNFRLNSWNKAVLSARQHFIAHWMLWKAYGGSQETSFYLMCNGQDEFKKSKTYLKLKQEWNIRNPFRNVDHIRQNNVQNFGVEYHSQRPEIRAKISESHKGKTKSEEHRKNLSNSKKDTVCALDENGNYVQVTKEEFKQRNLNGVTKGKSVYKDKDGNKFSLSVNDPRVLSGELISVMNDGRITYTNSIGEKIRTTKDDPRVLSGEFKHSNAGTIAINNGSVEKRIKEDQLDEFISLGWTSGGLPTLEKRIHIHKMIDGKIKSKMIDPNELQNFVNEGWQSGRGSNGKKPKKIKCITVSKTFNHVLEAIEWLKTTGIDDPKQLTIMDCCRGRTKTAYKMEWEYT